MLISPEAARKSPVKLTYDHDVLFPNDGNRHEIIHGRHDMNAARNPRHQAVSRHIQFQLYEQIELIEILSPSNRNHDRELKTQLYEQSQVPEYWIVDPDEQTVTRFRLTPNGTFAEPEYFRDSISFKGTSGIALVDLQRVW